MAVNKVVDVGGNTLVDLTGDTVTAETLAEGVTAHNSAGEQITGTMSSGGGGMGCLYVKNTYGTLSVSGYTKQVNISSNEILYFTDGTFTVGANNNYDEAVNADYYDEAGEYQHMLFMRVHDGYTGVKCGYFEHAGLD